MIFYVERFGRVELDKIKTIDSIHADRDQAYTALRTLKRTDTDVSATYEVVTYNPFEQTWDEHLAERMRDDHRFATELFMSKHRQRATVTRKPEHRKPVLTIVK